MENTETLPKYHNLKILSAIQIYIGKVYSFNNRIAIGK